MKQKTTPPGKPKTQLHYPTHKEIEAKLQAEMKIWRMDEEKGPYPMQVLDFIIGHIGSEIENARDNEDFEYQAEYDNPSGATAGITNGEFYYSLYKTLLNMTQDESFALDNLPLCDQQVFASVLDLASALFEDSHEFSHEDGEVDQNAIDLWILYSWCCQMNNKSVWEDEDGKSMEPPKLEALSKDDWQRIVEEVRDYLMPDSDPESLHMEMGLLDEQPHWPTFQEFRKATSWILHWYRNIRQNRKFNWGLPATKTAVGT